MHSEEETLEKLKAIVEWNSSKWAAKCSAARKKDGAVRAVQGFQSLNAILKSQSDGLDDMFTVFDEMSKSTCYTCAST